MKTPAPKPSLVESAAEAIGSAIFYWLFATKVATRNDPPMIVAMLSWALAHAVIVSVKYLWRIMARIIGAAARLIGMLAAPH